MIEAHAKALETTWTPSLSWNKPRSVDSLTAMSTDTGVVEFLAQAKADIAQIDRIQESLQRSRQQLHLRQARMRTALAPVSVMLIRTCLLLPMLLSTLDCIFL